MDVSILIPTTGRREALLAETKNAYAATLAGIEHEILTTALHSWGGGINELRTRAKGELLLYAADDATPHPGWYQSGVAALARGRCPAARFLTRDGTPEAWQDQAPDGFELHWTRFPFLPASVADQVGPLLDLSWFVDFDYSRRLEVAGWPIVACEGFVFTHHDAPRDWLNAGEQARQRQVYLAASPANV